MKEIVLRFLLGGLIVSMFSLLADLLRPKSFAGLLGAAPSVALATLGLTIYHNGKIYASIEGRSMILGAAGFFAYAALVRLLLRRERFSPLFITLIGLPFWFIVSFGLLAVSGASR